MGGNLSKESLYSAIDSSDENWIETIIKAHPEYINQPMTSDCLTTPLGRACWRGSQKICDLLIKLGADINFTGEQGLTPLMWACIRDHKALMKDFLNRGANYNLQSKDKLNALDYAILYGNYETALFLFESTDLVPKMIELYENYGKEKNIRYCNYRIFVDHLILKVKFESVPNFSIKETQKEQVYNDPVIDPRETWGTFFKRIIEFEDPPLVERHDLPKDMQPQNRFLGKMRSYINGMSPYPYTTIQLREEDKAELEGNHSKEIKNVEMNEVLNPNKVNLVDVNLGNK